MTRWGRGRIWISLRLPKYRGSRNTLHRKEVRTSRRCGAVPPAVFLQATAEGEMVLARLVVSLAAAPRASPTCFPASAHSRCALPTVAGYSPSTRIIESLLLRFHLGFGWGTDANDSDATGELRQPLLQLLFVVIASCLLNLTSNLFNAPLDLAAVPGAADNCGVLLVDHNALGATERGGAEGGKEDRGQGRVITGCSTRVVERPGLRQRMQSGPRSPDERSFRLITRRRLGPDSRAVRGQGDQHRRLETRTLPLRRRPHLGRSLWYLSPRRLWPATCRQS